MTSQRTRPSRLHHLVGAPVVCAALIFLAVALGWRPAPAADESALPERRLGEFRLRPRLAAVVESRRIHHVGKAWMAVGNDGTFGSYHQTLAGTVEDQRELKINYTPSFEQPGGSRLDYLYMGSVWIGAIVGPDTLVSLGHGGGYSGGNEFLGFAPIVEGIPAGYPSDCKPRDTVTRGLAQVYSCVYYDTLVMSNNSEHVPIGLEITQVSLQGADTYSQGFIIVDQRIKNISDHPLEKIWLGVYADNDIWYQLGGWASIDDISGFVRLWPNPSSPTYQDTLNVAWAADNDGDPVGSEYKASSCKGAMGFRILRTPPGCHINFNWWASASVAAYDWGPRLLTDLRGLGTGGNGTPEDDRAKYHFMANGEIDYDQLFSAVDYTADGWKSPPGTPFGCGLGDGYDTYLLLSAGPVPRLDPGEEIAFTYALIAADSVHRDPKNRYDCNDPQTFYNKLGFSDLARNAWWAGFVFDNFGVDTDRDGYAGESFVDSVSGQTVYYTGDGCPDFTGPSSPACPQLELISRPHTLTIRWSGATTELTPDPQLLVPDFEGYRIYYAERNSPNDIPAAEDYVLMAGWDRIDYRRYTWDPEIVEWAVSSAPRTLAQWRQEFNDPDFDPLAHGAPSFASCYHYTEPDSNGVPGDRCAYFTPQDYNIGNRYVYAGDTVENLIQCVAVHQDTSGYEYGEYEVTLSHLSPAKHYFISVTAFDFGDPVKSLPPLEATPGQCRVMGVPIYSADVVEAYWDSGGARRDSVRVAVYPNPYKISYAGPSGERTSYYEQGYEGTTAQRSSGQVINERDRRIHFINVPADATIRIWTLDGDLVRTLEHPDDVLTGYSSKISWDLVSRNTQAVTSGIYIYRVDSRLGSQVGKIVIIK